MAKIQRQDERFMRFLYKLSSANYHWGSKRSRGRGERKAPSKYDDI